MYREKWESYTAELELLQNANTTHADFLAMRQAVDARRDEKQRLEHVSLEYRTKNLGSTILAKRAQIHAQYYQEVRQIRDKGLETLNADYCQIQRERRQFIRKEPYFLPKFQPDRRKQVEDQQRYNKEVSLLSGIARHKGFPSAPKLQNTAQEDLEEDFRQMRVRARCDLHTLYKLLTTAQVPQTVPRAISYSELARNEHANEAAAEKSWAERTPWADPKHIQLHRVPVIEAQNARIPVASPPTPVQAWMMNGASVVTTNEQRPEATTSDPQNQPQYTENAANGVPTSSPFDQLKRQSTNELAPTSWRDNVQAHLANRLSNNTTPRVDKSPFETRATKTSASYPIDPTSLHQSYATSALHSGGVGGSRAGSELLGSAGFAPRPGALGTPGFEREGSRLQGFPGFGPIGEDRRDGPMHRTPEAAASVGGVGGR